MRTLRPSPSAFALSSLVWLLPFTLGLAAPGASAVSDDDSEEIEELEAAQWQDVLDTLDVLWGGTREERLRFIEDGEVLLDALEDPARDRTPQVHATVESLRTLFANERDEWFLDRLALALADGTERLTPLFLDLLQHRSLNLRWRAVGHFYETEDPVGIPLLAALWRESLHPWIRIDLIDALEDLEWEPLWVECLPLMDSEHLELAIRAIEVVGEAEAPGAVTGLVRRAGKEPAELQVAALDALSAWSESAEALKALLKATYEKEPSVRSTAVRSLAAFEFERAQRRVHAAATDIHEDPVVRRAAVAALEQVGDPGAADTLMRIVEEPDSASNAVLHWIARSALQRMGVAGFDAVMLPGVSTVDASTGHWMLQVNPNSIHEMEVITAGVGVHFGRSHAVPEDGFSAIPDGGARSIRCWAGPEIPANPPNRPRLEAGWWVDGIEDYFDHQGRVWVEIWSGEDLCWVPMERLEESNGANRAEFSSEEEATLVIEFDAPAEAADSMLAQELDALGVLTIFDPTERAVAFRLSGHDLDDVVVPELLALVDDDDSALSQGLRTLLRSLARNTDDADLQSRFLETVPE